MRLVLFFEPKEHWLGHNAQQERKNSAFVMKQWKVSEIVDIEDAKRKQRVVTPVKDGVLNHHIRMAIQHLMQFSAITTFAETHQVVIQFQHFGATQPIQMWDGNTVTHYQVVKDHAHGKVDVKQTHTLLPRVHHSETTKLLSKFNICAQQKVQTIKPVRQFITHKVPNGVHMHSQQETLQAMVFVSQCSISKQHHPQAIADLETAIQSQIQTLASHIRMELYHFASGSKM
jgi:hypothetical protein